MAGASRLVPQGPARRPAAVIFVTLGTHPQPMMRLVPELERIARELPELGPFHAQTGVTPAPTGWIHHSLIPATAFRDLITSADIVITHGGPATIAEVRAAGRVPIVAPRRSAAHEHVDDHQMQYARRLAAASEVILVEDASTLFDVVRRYGEIVQAMPPARPLDAAAAIEAFGVVADRLLSRSDKSAGARPTQS